MKYPESTFALEAGATVRELLDHAVGGLRAQPGGESSFDRRYLDTFDAALYRSGSTLIAIPAGDGFILDWQARDGSFGRRLHVAELPGFADELDNGPFRKALLPLSGIRRLLPVAHVQGEAKTIALLDQREKTVLRLRHESGTVRGQTGKRRAMASRLRLVPVRGYDGHRKRVARQFETELGASTTELQLACGTLGGRPDWYSSKLRLEFRPGLPAGEAVRQILARLFETMRDNEEGTRKDLDSEFLHDFRVAVRRTRSCLGQLGGVLDPAAIEAPKREFAWLGKITGRTRDLDVYLLNIDGYREQLEETLRPGLDGLERWLRDEQRREQKKLSRTLGGARYAALKKSWAAFLDEPYAPAEGLPDADLSTRVLASLRIRESYRKVCKRGSKLDHDSKPARVHRLRIECKKLRYLLEFFRSVFDGEQVEDFVRSLKGLQDRLGDYNDLEVQQDELRRISSEIAKQGDQTAPTLLAMGALVGDLAIRQKKLKRKVIESVHAFVDEERQQALEEMTG
jgi:CHAD domain-containing protein